VLSVERLHVTIRGFVILRSVSLEIPPGGLVGLCGRNGAGKTTTLKALMGLVPVASGRVALEGRDLAALAPHRRAKLGIGYVPEDRRLIGQLTVEENLLLPVWATGRGRADDRLQAVYALMPAMRGLSERRAAQLSGGQQKLVAVARALMIATRLLLLDEPFEGLSPAVGDTLAATIQAARRDGLSVLVAESDVKRLGFVERIYGIERGEIVKAAA
jgi:branched-chain amino acid transport system ATP-binding protein